MKKFFLTLLIAASCTQNAGAIKRNIAAKRDAYNQQELARFPGDERAITPDNLHHDPTYDINEFEQDHEVTCSTVMPSAILAAVVAIYFNLHWTLLEYLKN